MCCSQVDGGRNICICGSSNLDWIEEFESRIKKLQNSGLQIQVIYIGSRNASENTQTKVGFFNKDISFTPIKIRFFWRRLEKIKDSILRVGQFHNFANYETLLKQVSELLDTDDDNSNWAVFGCGNSKDSVKLQGNKILKFFERVHVWALKLATLGLVGAIRSVDDDDEVNNTMMTCDHTNMVPYDQGPVICDKCKRLMKPFVVYQCDGSK